MPSYQDIETRLQQVERMVKFALCAFQVVDVSNPFAKPHTLLDEYYKSLQPNSRLIIAPEDPTPVEVHTDQPDGTITAEIVTE